MLKRFNRLLALAAVLFTGLGLWAAPPAADAPVPNRTAPPTVGGDQSAIVDRANRRRELANARAAAAARAQAALKAKGGKVSPLALGQNPANINNAAKFAKANQANAAAKGAGDKNLGLAVLPNTGIQGPGFQLAQPDYMLGTASNWHNTKRIPKFVDGLAGIGAANANNLGNYIPFAVPDQDTYKGSDYYEIDVVQYYQQFHSKLNPTLLRGYQAASGLTAGVPSPAKKYGPTGAATKIWSGPFTGPTLAGGAQLQSNYLGPIIIAKKDRAVRVKMTNKLPTGAAGDLFIPVDTTVMGTGIGHLGGTEVFSQNRAEFHLHGGLSPWISDGTPHQWVTPAGDPTSYKKGLVFKNVPDMVGSGLSVPSPSDGDGIGTYFWSNQQSGRLMFYHDHTFGLTRLNVYAGEAAGYLIVDPVETKLINQGLIPSQGTALPISDDPWDAAPPAGVHSLMTGGSVYTYGIPLVIQDKTFVDTSMLGVVGELQIDPRNPTGPKTFPGTDPTWDVAKYGGDGSLWFPHVYMPNQNPADMSGANGMGRWDYAQWFWPPYPLAINNPGGQGLQHGAQPLLATDNSGKPIPVMDPLNPSTQLPVLGVLGAQILDPTTGQRILIPNDATTGLPFTPPSVIKFNTLGEALNPATNLPFAANYAGFFYQAATPKQIYMADGVTPAMQWQLDPNGTEYPGTPNPSLCPEAFMDTPVVNGTAYPTITVEPAAYRFRILSAANDRNWNLSLFKAYDPTGGTNKTEVPTVPAVPTAGWPVGWPTDGRDGGVPAPSSAGPSFIQIGNESGFLPAPTVIPPFPINYTYNRRNIVVLSIQEKALFMGPGERADVIVDFSQFAGETLILYNDAPAPVPAFDVRFDYYTDMPDNTATGGSIPTIAGYGPNTRTIMQFKVNGTLGGAYPAFDLAALNAAFASTATSKGAFAEAQHLPIVPQDAYASALNLAPATTASLAAAGMAGTPVAFANNVYARIQDLSVRYPFPAMENGVKTQPGFENKAIQELFELDYGRMNATLGVELPRTNAFVQTTIPLGYADPTTEDLYDGATQYWKITHNGVDTHPVHFHLFDVQIINRVGWDGAVTMPNANEVGWKETVRMNPLEDIVVAFRPISPRMPANMTGPGKALKLSNRPADVLKREGILISWTDHLSGNPVSGPNASTSFEWEYVWHCHILGHEENDFMRPMVLHVATDAPLDPTDLKAASPILPGRADLSWTDNNTDASARRETGFSVQRRTPEVVITPAVPQVGTAATADYQAASRDYAPAVYDNTVNPPTLVTAQVGTPQVGTPASPDYAPAIPAVTTGPGPWVEIGTTVPNQNRYSDFSIKPNTAYDYQVVAYNQAGYSGASKPPVNFGAQPISYSGLAYSIVGGVNVPTAGVLITFTGTSSNASSTVPASTTAITDATGAYSATLPYNWTGTVTPSAAGLLFAPVSVTYNLVGLNALITNTVQNFVASPIVTISGSVTIPANTASNGLDGVTVTFSNGGGTATTAGGGLYSIAVPKGYSGTATLSLAGYVFAPIAPTTGVYANVAANTTGQNYAATKVASISGTVTATDSSNAPSGLQGVTITPSSAGNTTVSPAITGSMGTYTLNFAGLPWSGTLAAAFVGTGASYDIVPAPQLNSKLASPGLVNAGDNLVQDFAATQVVTISGKVAGTSGAIVKIDFVDAVPVNGGATFTTTDASGNYLLKVRAPFTGNVTPSYTGLVFSAANIPFNNQAADVTTANFQAQVQIKGTVSYLGQPVGTLPLFGATITAAGTANGTATTAADGSYTLTLNAPWVGTLTPSLAGYIFYPASSASLSLALSSTQNFQYAPGVEVSGQIYINTVPITPLANVAVSFTNGGGPGITTTVLTDANGNYFGFVPRGWTGTVTPILAGYAFNPLSRNFTNVTTTQTGRNFVVSSTVVLSGIIYSGTTPLNGVTVTLNNGGGTFVTGTAINGVSTPGYYQITLNSGWTGTVTPTARGRIFSPTSIAQQLTKDTTLNFYTYQSITGQARVRVNGTNYGVSNVTITATGSGSSANATATTLANGNFTLLVLTGWTGTITASGGTNPITLATIATWNPAGFTYTSTTPLPAGQFPPVTANVTGLRFTGL